MNYEVVGKFSEININTLFTSNTKGEMTVNKKAVKALVAAAMAVVITIAFQEVANAAELAQNQHWLFEYDFLGSDRILDSSGNFKKPSSVKSILLYIDWLVDLAKYIISSICGGILMYAGKKWATDISGGGQAKAKEIILNVFIGSFWVWCGVFVTDFFIGGLIQFLDKGGF